MSLMPDNPPEDDSLQPTRIPTAWGDFWAIGDGTGRIFLTEEDAAQALAREAPKPLSPA